MLAEVERGNQAHIVIQGQPADDLYLLDTPRNFPYSVTCSRTARCESRTGFCRPVVPDECCKSSGSASQHCATGSGPGVAVRALFSSRGNLTTLICFSQERLKDLPECTLGKDPVEPGALGDTLQAVPELLRMEARIRIGQDGRDRPGAHAAHIYRIEQRVVSGDNGANIAFGDTGACQSSGKELRGTHQFSPSPTPGRRVGSPMNDCDRIGRLVRVLAPSVPDTTNSRGNRSHTHLWWLVNSFAERARWSCDPHWPTFVRKAAVAISLPAEFRCTRSTKWPELEIRGSWSSRTSRASGAIARASSIASQRDRVTLAYEGLFGGVAHRQDNKDNAPLLLSSQHYSVEGFVLRTVKEVMATLILLTNHRRSAEQSGGGPIIDTGSGLSALQNWRRWF